MRNLFLTCCFFALITACSQKQTEPQAAATNIMAYYVPNEKWSAEQLPLEKLSHIIFSFTEVLDGEMKFPDEKLDSELRKLMDQKSKFPNLKVMVACGGWTGSKGFSDMALTEESRKKFIDSAMKFMDDYQIDGLDIDWEYPGLPGDNNVHRPEDKENFTALMKGLREAMDATGKKYLLTFASAGWKMYYDHIETTEVMKYADYMNVMTYDLVGGGSPFTAHHTNLGWVKNEAISETPLHAYYLQREQETGKKRELSSAESILNYCIELGVKPEQLVIGGAFYGRSWKGVSPENNGLYQANKGVGINWLDFDKIRSQYEDKNGYVRYWDEIAKAPYLFNPTDSIFISYDDTTSVKLKTRYVIDQKMGGIMFWQLTNDTQEPNSLLDAIYTEAMK